MDRINSNQFTFRKNLLDYTKGKIVKRDSEQQVITDIQADTITRITSGEGDNVYQMSHGVLLEVYQSVIQ